MSDAVQTPPPITDEELVAILNKVEQPKPKPKEKPEAPRLKLSLDPNACRKAIAFVAGVVPNKCTLPVLGMLHVAGNGSVIVRATDLDVTLSSEIDSKALVDGVCLLPKAPLLSALKSSKKRLAIEMGPKLMADIVADGFKQTVPTLGVEEFPPDPKMEPEVTLQVDATELRAALKRVEGAISTDESRYILNGVLFQVNPFDLTLVATDGRRLHLTHVVRTDKAVQDAGDDPLAQKPSDPPSFIVPAATVRHILRLPVEKTGIVTIEANPNAKAPKRPQMILRYGPHTIISNLVEGNYPNYRQVIPSEHKEKVKLDATTFAAAVRHAETVTSDKANSVRLSLKKNMLTVSAGSPETGEANSDLSLKYRGADLTIAFNPRYLLGVADAFKGQEFHLELIDELSPGVFRNGQTLMVVMPMRLS